MNFLIAFVVGGFICVCGQILMDKTKLTPARIMVGFVVLGAVLGGFGIYDKFVSFAGAGATVPLIGFGNLLSKSTIEAIEADGISGIFTGGLSGAAGGITAAIVFGYLGATLFKSKTK